MTSTKTLVILGALCAASGCVRQIEPPPEKLGSFNVTLRFDDADDGGVVDANNSCGDGSDDNCPLDYGTYENPLEFPAEAYTRVFMDIEAVSTKGKRPYDVNMPVAIGLRGGEIWGPSRQVRLVNGVVENFEIRVRRTPGPTYLWVEDSIPPEDEEDGDPTFAVGVTEKPLYFAQPTIADIQRTNDECCNNYMGQRVDVTEGDLFVSRLIGNGFNVQDVSVPEWGGMFVFAFGGIEGLRVGTRLLNLGGAVTEFQSGTQLTEPIYTPLNGPCGDPQIFAEGGETTEEFEQGSARVRCPRGSECTRADDGVERCTPAAEGADEVDGFGRFPCMVGQTGGCPTGTECQLIAGQGTERECSVNTDCEDGHACDTVNGRCLTAFCMVSPVDVEPEAFPTAPYCGPIRTDEIDENGDGVLDVERLENMLVKIEAKDGDALGIRIEGLPVCAEPDVDDPLKAVRSSCYLKDDEGRTVVETDCRVATAGEPLLRDENGTVCMRNNQACLREDGVSYEDVQSTCNPDPDLSRCFLADPGDPVLTNCDGDDCDPKENRDLMICRNTLDDFLTSGFTSFGQAKVYFEDGGGITRCATVNFDALTGFDVFDKQEEGVRWKSLTGTLRQVRFRSESSFWMIDVRYPEDLVVLE